MRFWHGMIACLLLILSCKVPAGEAPGPRPIKLPEPLRPWSEWVLHGLEDIHCPILYNQTSQHRCTWPSGLTLTIIEQGGEFTQRWSVDADSWLILPGDHRHWPQDVQLDGAAALVLDRDGRPAVRVAAGSHAANGYFFWNAIPEALRVPADTAVLSLNIAGQAVPVPRIENDGTVWLRKQAAAPEQQDHLELHVFRRVVDDIPLRLTTRLELKVSGKPREDVLGRVLPADFIPLALTSPLPARLEADGRLRLQLKPGSWTIELNARHVGPVDSLSPPPPQPPWPAQEIWSFQAVPALRIVTVEGAPALDPAQTNLPQDWRQLPAYLLQPGHSLRLVTRKRGDADPVPDRLSLERTLWLDFAGKGYTVQDHLSGTVSQSSRLQAAPLLQLGRVAVNGQDQFITRLAGQSADGVEVRQGTLQLVADSRLEPPVIGKLPAVGWQLEPVSLRTTLNLPPGWRLLHADGADSASNTWLYRWTLLDLFIVLITAFSFARLWGWSYGVLALAGLTVIYHEPGAPSLLWLNVLAAIALLRVLPTSRLRSLITFYQRVSLLVLLGVAFVFAVQQVRSALYPQLAPVSMPAEFGIMPSSPPPPAEPVPQQAEQALEGSVKRKLRPYLSSELSSDYDKPQPQYDPNIKVQTGPGLPQWRWEQAVLSWSGPVKTGQELFLVLMPPWATRLLSMCGVILLLALLARVAGRDVWPRRPPAATALLPLCLLLPLTLPQTAKAAEFPSPELLQELRSRLTEPPTCQPTCAVLTHMKLRAVQDTLTLRLQFNSQVDTAVPLPLAGNRLVPSRTNLDGQDDVPLYRASNDLLWARLPAGQHVLELQIALPRDLATLQLPLPMAPGWIEAEATDWRVEGVYDGIAVDQIQLNRTQGENAPAVLQPGLMPAFVAVERELVLGIDWQVQTRVRRLSQADSAVVLEIPLLAGERVTSPGVRVRDNRVVLNLPPNQAEIAWSATLDQVDRLTLQAGSSTDYSETWRLRAAPLWHVETDGIPVIHRHDSSGQWTPEWRPWPGETLTLTISRPAGVAGKTFTIDDARLQATPGQRATEATLALVIRSSRGAEHTLSLPVGAELTGVTINGTSQPIKQNGQAVVLPLVPGTQNVNLSWRDNQGITTQFTTPRVDLGSDSVNSRLTLNLPWDRWTLFSGGPRLGPAVLFWGVLLVIAVGALALGRYSGTPLKSHHWFFLGAGLSQGGWWALLPVIGWLLLLGRRKAIGETLGKGSFDALQVVLVLLTLVAFAAALGAIQQGLLGPPEMQITGNNSSAYQLQWYQDRSPGVLPQAWVISVPLLVYRGLMLAWALWLAFALLRWLAWGWACFSNGGMWRRLRAEPAQPESTPADQATSESAPPLEDHPASG